VIIVAGHIRIAAANRNLFLAQSQEAIHLARATAGCHDFVVAADPVDPERVNVYERWAQAAVLYAFRRNGPGDELNALVLSWHVNEYDARERVPGR
jgi:quinol monooxygenase YgiN